MKYVRDILDVVLYVIMFLLIQLVMTAIVTKIMGGEPDTTGIIIASVVSSVLTMLLFIWLKWVPVSRSYLQSRPWVVVLWVVILALGTLIPSEWLAEQIPYEMPAELEAMMKDMLRNRWGYLAIGILAPLVEEMVFRGAVLRVLLRLFDQRWHWVPIVISALVFGAIHGNVQQFVHAGLIGLILGWMYYRTDSILPGVVFHWVNNSAAYVITNLMPNAEDVPLVDTFGGDQRAVYMALGFSCCLILPALFQLYLRLKKGE